MKRTLTDLEVYKTMCYFLENYYSRTGSDNGLNIQMIPFEEYAIDVIKSHNDTEIARTFEFVEFLICNGNELVQNAITTSFLEYLMSKDPDEIQFDSFVQYLGKNSIEYCRAWDKFTGVKTKGLWED